MWPCATHSAPTEHPPTMASLLNHGSGLTDDNAMGPSTTAGAPSTARRVVAIQQVSVLDQWGDDVGALIRKHNAPRAACGFISTQVAYELARRLPGAYVTAADVNAVTEALRDLDAIRDTVDAMMGHVGETRRAYIEAHPDDFVALASTDGESGGAGVPRHLDPGVYQSDWVANYEISDWIQNPDHRCPSLHFARMIERGEVHHEEKARVGEEERFSALEMFVESSCGAGAGGGGRSDGGSGAGAGTDAPTPGPTADGTEDRPAEAMTEAAAPATKQNHWLRAPSEWLREFGSIPPPPSASDGAPSVTGPVFISDVGGHFVVVKPCYIRDDRAESWEPVCVMFNSSKGDYTRTSTARCIGRMALLGLSEESEGSAADSFMHS